MKIKVVANITGYDVVEISKEINPMSGLPNVDELNQKLQNVMGELSKLGKFSLPKKMVPIPPNEGDLKARVASGQPVPVDIGISQAEATLGDVFNTVVGVTIATPVVAGENSGARQ